MDAGASVRRCIHRPCAACPAMASIHSVSHHEALEEGPRTRGECLPRGSAAGNRRHAPRWTQPASAGTHAAILSPWRVYRIYARPGRLVLRNDQGRIHDLGVMTGVEPHLAYRLFARGLKGQGFASRTLLLDDIARRIEGRRDIGRVACAGRMHGRTRRRPGSRHSHRRFNEAGALTRHPPRPRLPLKAPRRTAVSTIRCGG